MEAASNGGQFLGQYMGLILMATQLNPTYLFSLTESPLRRPNAWEVHVPCFLLRNLTTGTLHQLSAHLTLHFHSAHDKSRERQVENVMSGRYQTTSLMAMLCYVQRWAYQPPPQVCQPRVASRACWRPNRATTRPETTADLHMLTTASDSSIPQSIFSSSKRVFEWLIQCKCIDCQRATLMTRLAIDWGLVSVSPCAQMPPPGSPSTFVSMYVDEPLIFGKAQGSVKFVWEELKHLPSHPTTVEQASDILAASRHLLGATLMAVVKSLIEEEPWLECFYPELRLMYDPTLIGPLTIFKVEHRSCEARSIRNVSKGYVSRKIHRSHALTGPSLGDVVVRKSYVCPRTGTVRTKVVGRVSMDCQDEQAQDLVETIEKLDLCWLPPHMVW